MDLRILCEETSGKQWTADPLCGKIIKEVDWRSFVKDNHEKGGLVDPLCGKIMKVVDW